MSPGSIIALVVGVVLSCSAIAVAADHSEPSPVKIAVFDFELEDVTAAASLNRPAEAEGEHLQQATAEARRLLTESGRYQLVEVNRADSKAARDHGLRNCDGCENGIAMQLGAEQALLGILRRVTLTEYYVLIQVSDARTGKVLNRQAAAFSGSDEAWPSGVRMVIRHGVLATAPD